MEIPEVIQEMMRKRKCDHCGELHKNERFCSQECVELYADSHGPMPWDLSIC